MVRAAEDGLPCVGHTPQLPLPISLTLPALALIGRELVPTPVEGFIEANCLVVGDFARCREVEDQPLSRLIIWIGKDSPSESMTPLRSMTASPVCMMPSRISLAVSISMGRATRGRRRRGHVENHHAQTAELDLYQGQHQANLNRLEAHLSRHWPELIRVLDLNTVSLHTLIGVYGDPSEVCAHREQAGQLLQRSGRALPSAEKIEQVLASSETSLGLPCTPGERHWLQVLAQELRSPNSASRSGRSGRYTFAPPRPNYPAASAAIFLLRRLQFFLSATLQTRCPVGGSWRMDETYIKVNRQWRYLYRAVDTAGRTVDFLLTVHRDKKAALRFFRKAQRQHGSPEKVTIDKSGANTAVFEALQQKSGVTIEIRQNKHLNNLVEQDHRAVKWIIRPMLGFNSFRSARRTLAGIELMHMLNKGR